MNQRFHTLAGLLVSNRLMSVGVVYRRGEHHFRGRIICGDLGHLRFQMW